MVDFMDLTDGAETADDQVKQTKSDPISKRIRAAKGRLDRAKAKLARLEQMESRQARKAQARRHYILGEILLKQAFQEPGVDKIALDLINQVSERDKPLFAEIAAQLEAKIATEAAQKKPKTKPKPKPKPEAARRASTRKRNPQPKAS